jgi:hypothetical protein
VVLRRYRPRAVASESNVCLGTRSSALLHHASGDHHVVNCEDQLAQPALGVNVFRQDDRDVGLVR